MKYGEQRKQTKSKGNKVSKGIELGGRRSRDAAQSKFIKFYQDLLIEQLFY